MNEHIQISSWIFINIIYFNQYQYGYEQPCKLLSQQKHKQPNNKLFKYYNFVKPTLYALKTK